MPPQQWSHSAEYLYGIDLYNFGYWWESHELFEALWHAAGRESEDGGFYQALIQLAASNLKLVQGQATAMHTLRHRALIRLERLPSPYMGIDVDGLMHALRDDIHGPPAPMPPIRLRMSHAE